MNINWYPGHMTKARRLITESLKLVDVVIELVDSRIPVSSRNPDIDEIAGQKPRVIVLNKSDMADSQATKKWMGHFAGSGVQAAAVDSISGRGINMVHRSVDLVLKDKISRDLAKGIKKRPAKLMIVGIPNVGKSAFINRLAGRASAKTGDKPGITRAKQWIRTEGGYDLLDTPGILWPRFDDKTGLFLAYTGAIRDEVYDITHIACELCSFLAQNYPRNLAERYKLSDTTNMKGHEILTEIGRKRGCLISGGEIDLQRAAAVLLDEFRACKLGRITLEMP